MANHEESAPSVEDVFGRALRRARQAAGLSQGDLADLMSAEGVKLHPSAIAKMEERTPRTRDGQPRQARTITLNEAVAAARALDMQVEQMVVDDPEFRWAVDLHLSTEQVRGYLEEIQTTIEALAVAEYNLRDVMASATSYGPEPDSVHVPFATSWATANAVLKTLEMKEWYQGALAESGLTPSAEYEPRITDLGGHLDG